MKGMKFVGIIWGINVCAETERGQFVGIIQWINVGVEMKRVKFVGRMTEVNVRQYVDSMFPH